MRLQRFCHFSEMPVFQCSSPVPHQPACRCQIISASWAFYFLQACLVLDSGFCNLFQSPVLHSCKDTCRSQGGLRQCSESSTALHTPCLQAWSSSGWEGKRCRSPLRWIQLSQEMLLPKARVSASSLQGAGSLSKDFGHTSATLSHFGHQGLGCWSECKAPGCLSSPGAHWGLNIEFIFGNDTLHTLKTSLCQCKAVISNPKGKECRF